MKAVAKRLGVEIVAIESISPRISDVTAPVLNIRAANPDVIISTCYPAPAVLVAQKYAEFGMTKTPLVQAVQGIPVPAGFAKNVGNDIGIQFIGGQCLSHKDCASGCCALPCGICSGPGAQFQAGKMGCGFGG